MTTGLLALKGPAMPDSDAELFERRSSVMVRRGGVSHCEEAYDQRMFDTLLRMQRNHFWYRGRLRFLLAALRRELGGAERLRAIDLGGGCGGWIEHLHSLWSDPFEELALGDSSLRALNMASDVVGSYAGLYQVDLYDLGWDGRWDVVFLLDVLEHLEDDELAMRNATRALADGGLLLVTVPGLDFFWNYNDRLAGHKRRYSRRDLARLAGASGLRLTGARYFMFLLSPLLYLVRKVEPLLLGRSKLDGPAMIERSHRVPPAVLNRLLYWIFALETPWGLRQAFPWGTSLLGMFRKEPADDGRGPAASL
jgi:SAM-dependent methyltransferase